jgi:hypothetical protein
MGESPFEIGATLAGGTFHGLTEMFKTVLFAEFTSISIKYDEPGRYTGFLLAGGSK